MAFLEAKSFGAYVLEMVSGGYAIQIHLLTYLLVVNSAFIVQYEAAWFVCIFNTVECFYSEYEYEFIL